MEQEKALSFTTFDPRPIAWQYRFIWDLHNKIPWENGTQKFLLSGALGSAKTTAGAWAAIYFATKFNKADILIARKALPDLRDTLYKDVRDLLDEDEQLIEGEDYTCYDTTCRVVFHKTGSEILSRTWSDKKYKKARSLRLCLAIIEEGTENNLDDKEAHDTILQRLNRIPSIKWNAMIILTNPDSPSHWIYKDYIVKEKTDPNTHVYYSLTTDNPYIDKNYVRFLEENSTEAEADRMLRGLWVEIDKSRTYYAYDTNKSFRRETVYKLDTTKPIDLMCDFNIGLGKPMSWAIGQVLDELVSGEWTKTFHIFKEFHAFTMRTDELLEEMEAQGAFELPTTAWRVFGDATGTNKDTRSIRSDYEIIEAFLVNYRKKDNSRLQYSLNLPKKNPPLRLRHNTANGLFKNALGETRFFLYKGCDWVDEGFRLTEPKTGTDNIENDGPAFPFQHVTTAITYWTSYITNKYIDPRRSSMRSKT